MEQSNSTQQGESFWTQSLIEAGAWMYKFNDRRPEVAAKWNALMEIYAKLIEVQLGTQQEFRL